VLGHELVHAYQYDIMKNEGRGLRAAGQMPLWFVEGMAEYLTIGHAAPLTSMWMRDAVLHEDVPTIEKISKSGKYFPYRYGHALWAYITGRWDDSIVPGLYNAVIGTGFKKGFNQLFKISMDSLSTEWQTAIKTTYGEQIKNRTKPAKVGKKIVTGEGGTNLSPVMSPDGEYIAFISNRELFTLDLFLADAKTGEIIDKLVSSGTSEHFDALRFMDSAGSFSPNSNLFAFVVFEDGDNELAIVDVSNRSIQKVVELEGIDAITNLAWSPNGDKIAIAGMFGGIGNLYLYDLESKNLNQLTDDPYAQIQPAWSPDGETLAIVTDQYPGREYESMVQGTMNIGLIDVQSNEMRILSMVEGIKHINPQFSPDGKSLYFISNPDGFSDIYRYSFDTEQYYRVTRIATGISGLTGLSPAMSVARETGRMVFNVFEKMEYNIYALTPEQLKGEEYAPSHADFMANVTLPPRTAGQDNYVDNYVDNPIMPGHPDDNFRQTDYDADLRLVYVGQTGVGIAVNRFGTGLGGGINMLFSDLLGNHQLSVSAQVNGGIKDLGGQAFYLNRDHRIHYGAVVGHIPYQTGRMFSGIDSIKVDGQPVPVRDMTLLRQRVFYDQIAGVAEYPLSTNRRFEMNAGYTRISYDYEAEEITTTLGGTYIDSQTRDIDSPDALNLFQSSLAYVGDYSYFGFTSPIRGSRFRFEVEPTFGSLRFLTALADYRQYYFLNPVTFAFRFLHHGRYMQDAESQQLTPYFLGFETWVRGYDLGSFNPREECTETGNLFACPEFDRMVGSRVGVMNLEFRVPFFGTEQFGLLNFPYLPTELLAFFDAGVAWTKTEEPKLKFDEQTTERVPLFSTGLAARVNILGYLVGQVYYAYPFQRPEKGAHFGFLIAQGW
jgi:Tol biopolymer transport system component